MFEVHVHYYERQDNGQWNHDDPKVRITFIGKKAKSGESGESNEKTREEYTEQLARFCIRQFARRDVLVFDIVPYETIKRQVQVKPSKNGTGILIKGKKYSLKGAGVSTLDTDECETEIEEENVQQAQTTAQVAAPPPQPKQPQQYYDFRTPGFIPKGTKINHPLTTNDISRDDMSLPRFVIFTPTSWDGDRRYNLEVGKRYKVLARTASAIAPDLTERHSIIVENERNQVVKVSEIEFSAAPEMHGNPNQAFGEHGASVFGDHRRNMDSIVQMQDDGQGTTQTTMPEMPELRPRR